jgi:hypothetical protein
MEVIAEAGVVMVVVSILCVFCNVIVGDCSMV